MLLFAWCMTFDVHQSCHIICKESLFLEIRLLLRGSVFVFLRRNSRSHCFIVRFRYGHSHSELSWWAVHSSAETLGNATHCIEYGIGAHQARRRFESSLHWQKGSDFLWCFSFWSNQYFERSLFLAVSQTFILAICHMMQRVFSCIELCFVLARMYAFSDHMIYALVASGSVAISHLIKFSMVKAALFLFLA